jgi:hypothetical protein
MVLGNSVILQGQVESIARSVNMVVKGFSDPDVLPLVGLFIAGNELMRVAGGPGEPSLIVA